MLKNCQPGADQRRTDFFNSASMRLSSVFPGKLERKLACSGHGTCTESNRKGLKPPGRSLKGTLKHGTDISLNHPQPKHAKPETLLAESETLPYKPQRLYISPLSARHPWTGPGWAGSPPARGLAQYKCPVFREMSGNKRSSKRKPMSHTYSSTALKLPARRVFALADNSLAMLLPVASFCHKRCSPMSDAATFFVELLCS